MNDIGISLIALRGLTRGHITVFCLSCLGLTKRPDILQCNYHLCCPRQQTINRGFENTVCGKLETRANQCASVLERRRWKGHISICASGSYAHCRSCFSYEHCMFEGERRV